MSGNFTADDITEAYHDVAACMTSSHRVTLWETENFGDFSARNVLNSSDESSHASFRISAVLDTST